MKTTILSIFLSFLFFSCVSVEFTSPQPSGTKNLTSFPSSFHGMYYTNENDTFKIGSTFYKVTNTNDNSFFTEVENKTTYLSEALLLKKYGGYYFLNIKEKENWSVSILKLNKDQSISVGFIAGSSKELTEKLDFIKDKKIVKDEDGKIDKFILTPSKKEFKLLIKNKVFEESLVLQKIK